MATELSNGWRFNALASAVTLTFASNAAWVVAIVAAMNASWDLTRESFAAGLVIFTLGSMIGGFLVKTDGN